MWYIYNRQQFIVFTTNICQQEKRPLLEKQPFFEHGWHDETAQETAVKILIVDDHAVLRESLRSALAAYGFSVVACENPTEALLQIMFEEFQFIVTDYSMPGMTGLELSRRLRERLPSTIIIGMSGHDVSTAFLLNGANDFLQKPFPVHTLAMMISGDGILA